MKSPKNTHSQDGPTDASRSRWRWRNLSGLQVKLIVPYVLLTLLISMGGTFIVIRLVTSSYRERFVNQMNEAGNVAADGIVRQEQDHLENLRLMANVEGVPQALAAEDTSTLQALLWPYVLNNQVEFLAATDLTGRELLSFSREPAGDRYVLAQGADYSDYAPVRAVLEERTDALGDKYAGLLTSALGPTLYTSAPVHAVDTGELVGALLIGTRLERLLADLKAQALADIIVFDSSGNLATTLPEPDQVQAALDSTSPSPRTSNLPTDIRLYERDYQVVFTPLFVRQQVFGELGIVLPANFLVTTEATSRTTFSIIFSIATAGVILIGFVLARTIARPILRLRAMSQAVAAGDLDQTSGLHQSDEVGELAAAFDVMTQRLRERTAEAERLYAESVQRNKELAAINAELRETQNQLIQSEKLAAIGHLTAGIVHDVKNPLSVIKGMAEVLMEDMEGEASLRRELEVIRDSATKANRIVSDLLTFARQSAPEMQEQDLRATVESAIRLTDYLRRAAHVDLVKDLPAEPVVATYDSQQIDQVLINLIQNGIQAMPNRGTLRITLRRADTRAVLIVQDTGIGIPPENLTRVFDPFFTTKPEGQGTGLGLSVSYGILARHNARIEVDSQVGLGTTFTISLPLEQPVPVEGELVHEPAT